MSDLTLGQKIRNFRKARGMSQMALELDIGSAPGSISRIEKDKINPTKETLQKIIEALGVGPAEAAELFDIKLDSLVSGLIKVSKVLNTTFGLDKMLETITNELAAVIDGSSPSIWFWDEATKGLHLEFVNVPRLVVTLAEKAMGKSIKEVYLSSEDPEQRENYDIRCLLERRILQSTDAYDFVHGLLDRKLAKVLQKILGMKYGLAIPLIVDQKIIGVLNIMSKNLPISPINESIIELFASHVARGILYAQQSQELKNKLSAISE